MLELVPVIAAILIAFSIGSNDTSNAFGISIGCGALTFKRAIALLGVFVFFGILFHGQMVMKTVGKDLVDLNILIISLALLSSSLAIILTNWKKVPVSSHQAIVASLVGSAFAFGKNINVQTLINIVVSWFVSPFGAMVLSIFIYTILERVLLKKPLFKVEKYLKILLLISGIVIAYNTGANELSTALGPIVYYNLLTSLHAALLGSVLLFFGALMLSNRVIETVGKGITRLDAFSGFSAQFGAGLSVLIFTLLGMPVSTTYCIVGGIVGVGLLKSVRTIRFQFIKKIMLSWFLTPLISFSVCYILATLFFV
ncbi:inorganic phosphate transporter [Archaeoglobales archaeon]|nr:MAG: inorganic phosphate transporter [Archaeoglobales archaeon]